MMHAESQWRLATSADMPFLYDLVAAVDPRWWRCSREGLTPARVVGVLQHLLIGAVVLDAAGHQVGAAALFDAGSVGCATLDVFALPGESNAELVRQAVPAMVEAAFAARPLRHLYHERFRRDPLLLGALETVFRTEVVLPEFALVDGEFEDRSVRVLTAEAFDAWRSGRPT